jgi:hypothetical protein
MPKITHFFLTKPNQQHSTLNNFFNNFKQQAIMNRLMKAGLIACTLGSLLIAGCKKDSADVAVTGISLNETELTLNVGETATLTATLEPDNAAAAIGWQSAAPEVATVDKAGKVTAIAQGEATIIASANGETATCKVTVTLNITAAVNKITFDIEKVNTPVAPRNPGGTEPWFALAGNKIYYTNPSNSATIEQFMLAYNIGSNTFSSLTPHNEVCACGFESKLVTDGNNLFYIANEAWKYSIAGNTWSELNYPSDFKSNNGETGVAYNAGKIYFLGGRTANGKFKYYDIAANDWFYPATYYPVEENDMTAVNNRIYTLGGNYPDNNKFAYFDLASNSWKTLPDLPFRATNSSNAHTVASYGNRYIVALPATSQRRAMQMAMARWHGSAIPGVWHSTIRAITCMYLT